MSASSRNRLFVAMQRKGFSPAHVAEVGVYRPEDSNVYEYIMAGSRCTLVEADLATARLIRERFGARSNVTLHAVALCDHNGTVELVRRAASTFIRTLPGSPAMVNDGCPVDGQDAFMAEARTFDRIDDGTIDLLSVDIEGGEWFVIKHMKSRPAVISIETHGAAYINPFLSEILAWMSSNGYRALYKTKTDTVFVRERIKVNLSDKLRLALKNVSLLLRRFRKRIRATRRNNG